MSLCIVCQTHEQRDDSSFCSYSCATVHSIVIAQEFVLTNEEIKQLGLNRLEALKGDYIVQDLDNKLLNCNKIQ